MPTLFDSALRKIYGFPSLSLIGGVWKTGKTDFSLYLVENLLELGIITKVASNIQTEDNRVKFLSSLEELKWWLHRDNRVKLFILDEANVHLTKRMAMSRMNVSTVRLLGEVSKAHARIIIVAQEVLGVDKEFLNPTWCRAVWIKDRLKTARLISHLFHAERMFTNIPPTNILFDPYRIAPFTEHPINRGTALFKDEELNKMWKWANGTSCKALGVHNMQMNRMVRRYVKRTLEPKAKELMFK